MLLFLLLTKTIINTLKGTKDLNKLTKWNYIFLLILSTFILIINNQTFYAKALQEPTQSIEPIPIYSNLSELDGKIIATKTGAFYVDMLIEENLIKNPTFVEHNTINNSILDLQNNKVDAIVTDLSVANTIISTTPGLAIMQLSDKVQYYGIVLPKNSYLKKDIEKTIKHFQRDGTLDTIGINWFGVDESKKKLPSLDFSDFPKTQRNTITYFYSTAMFPLSYANDKGEALGYDIELAMRIAHALGMHIETTPINVGSIIPAIEFGMAEMAGGGLSITSKRLEKVDMIPYLADSIVLIVKAKNITTTQEHTIITNIKNVLNTIILEDNHYQTIIKGIVLAIAITFSSLLIALVLGAVLLFMLNSPFNILSSIAKIYIRVFNISPIIVFFLFIYYVTVGYFSAFGVILATILISIYFSGFIPKILRKIINSLDKKQLKNAKALEFGKRKTFFKIIFPQCLANFISACQKPFISLITLSFIVANIATEDLHINEWAKLHAAIKRNYYEDIIILIGTIIIYFIVILLIECFFKWVYNKMNCYNKKVSNKLKTLEDNNEK